jgi:hypothetical protein
MGRLLQPWSWGDDGGDAACVDCASTGADSHCPMLSHPDVVLDAIRNLVTSLQGALATA